MLPRASGLVVALGALVAHAQAQSGFMVIPDSPDRTAMQSECGPSDRQAAVRCCSDTVIVGWPQNVGCSVWSASELTSQIGALSVPEARESNGCAEAATHEQAVAICAAEGARLCTADEVNSDCSTGTGCGHNGRFVWTSSPCECAVTQNIDGVTQAGFQYLRWNNIQGSTVEQMLADPEYLDGSYRHRARREIVNDFFEGGRNVCNNCGSELIAWFHPAQNGNHIFSIASDDSSRLYFGDTQEQAEASEPIAVVNGNTGYRQWTKTMQQRTAPQSLRVGRQYFMKIVHNEGGGGDHVAVAMLEPNDYPQYFTNNAPPISVTDTAGHTYLTTEYVADSCCIPLCLDDATRDDEFCDATTTCNAEVPVRNPSRCGWNEAVCDMSPPEVIPMAYLVQPFTEEQVCTRVSGGARRAVQCCHGRPVPRSARRAGCDVYGRSDFRDNPPGFNQNCYNAATYEEALGICDAGGGRLCTSDELLQGCTENTGCGHDLHVSSTATHNLRLELSLTEQPLRLCALQMVWTSDPCEIHPPACEAAGCPSFWMADGVCDIACDNRQCSFDGGDCKSPGQKLESGAGTCLRECQAVEFGQNVTSEEQSCLDKDGCGWTEQCVVENRECSSKTVLECNAAPGCRFEYPLCVEQCPGLGETVCDHEPGCSWTGPAGYFDDFELVAGPHDWKTNNDTTSSPGLISAEHQLMMCGQFGEVLGGNAFGGRDVFFQRAYNLTAMPHTILQVELDFIALDRWDWNDEAQLHLDGDLKWSAIPARTADGRSYRDHGEDRGNICGAYNHVDRVIHIVFNVSHTSPFALLRVSTTLDGPPNDESFAIDNVRLTVATDPDELLIPGTCDSTCNAMASNTTCDDAYSTAGCTWQSECVADCSSYDEPSACAGSGRCLWSDDQLRCLEPTTCGMTDNAVMCGNLTGCAWEPFDATRAKCDPDWIADQLGLPSTYDRTQLESNDPDCLIEEMGFECPDKKRQLLTEGGCECEPGYYDATDFEIHCWETTQKQTPGDDLLNLPFVTDIANKFQLEGNSSELWKSTCIACPSCVDCSRSSQWADIAVNEGYSVSISSVDDETEVVDIFKCPMQESCLANVTFAEIVEGKTRKCSEAYDSSTALCGSCADGYILEGNSCTECSLMRPASLLVVLVILVFVFFMSLSRCRKRCCHHHFMTLAQTMDMLGKRIYQSIALIVTNYQILCGLPERAGVTFPPMFTKLLNLMANVVNVDILQLPGLACAVGSSFYTQFLSNMLVPFFIVVMLHFMNKHHVKYVRSVTMPMPSHLTHEEVEKSGAKGTPDRRRIVVMRANFKLCRAIVISKVQNSYHFWMYFVVFLRLPACSRLLFDVFKCRSVGGMSTPDDSSDDVSLLEADYREKCGEGNHETFFALGIFFLFAYVIFIPLAFEFKLDRFKTTILGKAASHNYRPEIGKKGERGHKKEHGHAAIPGNHEYIELSPYRPIFMFYKHEAYRFEIYFWVEKGLLLVGSQFAGMLLGDNTGIFQWFINMLVTLYFLVLVAYYQPSIETRFNHGNVLVHFGIVYTYMCSLLLNPRLLMQGSFIEQAGGAEFLDVTLVVIQLALGAFLIWSAFRNWTSLWKQAREHVHTMMWFEAEVSDNVEYYEEMQRHFPPGVAMILTKMHHHEDLHGYHVHARKTRHDKKQAKKLLQEYKKGYTPHATDEAIRKINPLAELDTDAEPEVVETKAERKAREKREKQEAKAAAKEAKAAAKAAAKGGETAIAISNPLLAGNLDDDDDDDPADVVAPAAVAAVAAAAPVIAAPAAAAPAAAPVTVAVAPATTAAAAPP